MTSIKLLALDVSLRSTGYSFWDTRESEPLSVGAIQPKSKGLERFKEILGNVERIKRAFGKIDLVVFEGYPFFLFGFQKSKKPGGDGKFYRSEFGQGPGNQIFGLAGITEMIKMKCHYQWQVPYANIPPTSIKKYATGYGRATKEMMIKQLHREHGVEFRTNDEVDSWWIGQLSRAVILFVRNEVKPESKERLDAIKSLLSSNNPDGTWNWNECESHDKLWGRKRLRKKRKRHAKGS